MNRVPAQACASSSTQFLLEAFGPRDALANASSSTFFLAFANFLGDLAVAKAFLKEPRALFLFHAGRSLRENSSFSPSPSSSVSSSEKEVGEGGGGS